MKFIFRITLIITHLSLILFSCVNDMETVSKYINMEIEPDVLCENVEVLYSDSARLQMKLTAPLLKIFTSATEQRREFPQGLHVWMYKKTGELEVELTANWAKHDLTVDLWEARSNVVIINSEGTKLESEQFFWDPPKAEVYSPKDTKITKENGTIATGSSFWAKQDFLDYRLIKGNGAIMYYDEPENQP